MGIYSGPNAVIDGLIFAIDPANPKSYSGSGTGVTELSRVSANVSLNSGVAYYNAIPKGYFEFDGVNDNIPFTLTNYGTTLTIEVWAKFKSFGNGMILGFNKYDIFSYNGAIGYNTANSDQYGLTSTQVTNLGLLNQWKHYIFEMRSDVSYTNNKIYINGQLQSLSQVLGTELTSNRDFNSGNGRINSWLFDNGYFTPIDIALFRVYNRALTQTEITNNYNYLNKRFNYLENIVTDSLALYLDPGKYTSYSGTGTSWYDLSGNNNNSTLVNGVAYSYRGNGLLTFDGTNDYVTVNNSANILSTTSYTKMVYFYITSFSTSNNLISGGASSQHAFWLNGSNRLYAGHNGSWSTVTGSTILSLNTWYHGAVTFDTTNGWKLYLNGVQDGTNASTTTFTGSQFINIGSYDAGNYLTGIIGALQVYNKALSAAEITQNYNAFKQRYGLT